MIECNDLLEWAFWFESANRQIAESFIGELRVSTVFLGLDHNFGSGPPLLFETMVFGLPVEMNLFGKIRTIHESLDYQIRYSTYDEAQEGHRVMCEEIKRLINDSEQITARALARNKDIEDG